MGYTQGGRITHRWGSELAEYAYLDGKDTQEGLSACLSPVRRGVWGRMFEAGSGFYGGTRSASMLEGSLTREDHRHGRIGLIAGLDDFMVVD